VLALFSHSLAIVGWGAFALGCALGTRRMNGWVATSLFSIGPLAAILTYQIINPEPGCTGDCAAQLGWGFFLLFSTLAWWAGLVTGVVIGSTVRRRSQK
jgi:hypothetical protein